MAAASTSSCQQAHGVGTVQGVHVRAYMLPRVFPSPGCTSHLSTSSRLCQSRGLWNQTAKGKKGARLWGSGDAQPRTSAPAIWVTFTSHGQSICSLNVYCKLPAPKSHRWGLRSAQDSSMVQSGAGTLPQPWHGWVGSNPDFLPALLGERWRWDLFPKCDADVGTLLLFLAACISLSRLTGNQAAVQVLVTARGCGQAPEERRRRSSTREQCASTVTITFGEMLVLLPARWRCLRPYRRAIN